MSHVDDASHDFDDLEGLDPKTKEAVKGARMKARDIIDRLEPVHISGWPSLIRILEDGLQQAKAYQNFGK